MGSVHQAAADDGNGDIRNSLHLGRVDERDERGSSEFSRPSDLSQTSSRSLAVRLRESFSLMMNGAAAGLGVPGMFGHTPAPEYKGKVVPFACCVSPAARYKMMVDATCAVAFLHEKGFIHCDIKSLNFLVTQVFHLLFSVHLLVTVKGNLLIFPRFHS